ncbi:MAG: DNA polymerase III subunit alpha [Bacteroidales bacterium]|nr:DNA polymerase III subunit alpha [Bacteroidales bacterium]
MYPFVHLHVHSQFSILDGQASISAIVNKAKDDGMRGIALTDHGNMFGIKEFHDYCNKINGGINGDIKNLNKELKNLESAETLDIEQIENIKSQIEEKKSQLFKPIFGCEMYVAEKSLYEHTSKSDTGRHLIVLAKNKKGYHNLIKLVSKAWTDGFYSHPRTDKEHLQKYHEGLIICSACIGGEIPRLILQDRLEEARESAKWFKNVFGDDFYLELQRHKATVPVANHETILLQERANIEIIKIAQEHNIKLICSNDVHFVNENDAEAHDRLICLSTGKILSDEKRMLYSKQEWLKTQEEMNAIFADIPEALTNTLEILDKVEMYSIDHDAILPNFPLPDGFTDNDDYLRYLVYEGAKKRWGELNEEHTERIDFELNTIKNMGFPGYFLIVQDFIQAARNLGVSVGPGRGSAAGSAVAYCLGITQIDPIKYDLLFERFLNPDRISLPDIDIDFDDDGRASVLKYVTQKYGEEKVAHIITYGTMAAKMAIKDVARVHNLPIPESDRLSKFIPSKPNDMPNKDNGKKYPISISNCLKCFPEFAAEKNNPNPVVASTIEYAEALEGNIRSTGVHACGVIIGRDDITDWVPVSTAPDKDGNKMLVTQYEGSVIETTGLIKMDFLGLKTLSIIKEALANIKYTHNIDIDIENIPIDDTPTYQLYCEGRTVGTFQFESPGMQKYLIELQPSTFEDLIAMNALYRPGPMDYIPDFIDRKHGRKPIVYDIPIMEKYLKDTYGITVYQEQVMLLSRLLGNFTRGESDALRKAMGKKLRDKLDQMKPKFIDGGKSNGHNPETLEKIWQDWEKFASYAFNKSHATCYSWVAYQTAYLKANYPSEYMAAVLSRNLNDIEKLTKFMDECKSMNIPVKGPDINESYKNFSANKSGEIRFGLGGIKTVGINAVEAIITEREANGPYKSIFDFVERVNLSSCNKRAMEALVLAGCFDSFKEVKRETFFGTNNKNETFLELLMRYGSRYQEDKQNQATSLFGGLDENVVFTTKPEIPIVEDWSNIYMLDKEKEYVGMYLSAHPLDPYYMEVEYGCNTKLKEIKEKTNELDKELIFCGLVVEFIERTTKNGAPFGILKLEDYSGSYEIRLFKDNFVNFRNYGIPGTAIIARGAYQKRKFNDTIDFNLINIELLEKVQGTLIHSITITIPAKRLTEDLVKPLKEFATTSTQNKGNLFFNIFDDNSEKTILFKSQNKMPISVELINFLKSKKIDFEINKD